MWTGDPALADAALLPDLGRLADDDWVAVGGESFIRADAQLVADNLMDLSHVGFVHTSTIGNAQMGTEGKIKVEKTDRGVRATRWVMNCTTPPLYVKTGRLPAGCNIDRSQFIDFIAPGFVVIRVGAAETGTAGPEGNMAHGLNLYVVNVMTPGAEGTTR